MEAYVRCVNSKLKDLRAIFVSPATVAQWISSADSKNMDLVPAVTHISDRDKKKMGNSCECSVHRNDFQGVEIDLEPSTMFSDSLGFGLDHRAMSCKKAVFPSSFLFLLSSFSLQLLPILFFF